MGDALKDLAARIRSCTLCRLHEGREHAVPGEGPPDAKLFLVGEAPGRHEDEEGRPFVGAAGKVLDAVLGRAGLSRRDVFITNVVKCRPPENRKPRPDEIAACRPYLLAQIRAVGPAVLVALGDTAAKSLAGPAADVAAARRRSSRFEGSPVIATYHPAATLYNRRLTKVVEDDITRAAKLARIPRLKRSGKPRPGKPVRTALSSGCAVIDPEGRILLIRRADERIWGLPKGTVEPGETLEQTAVREVREETGLQVRILAPLTEIRYRFYSPRDDANVDKRVVYFLAERVGGRLKLEPGFDDARWFTKSDALRRLHFENDRNVVRRAFEALAGSTGRIRGRGPAARR
ncbi:MAG: NUDIX domain-containing protein [Methanobacteriota archaeon]|nr:MAG: NUDIX domain-containing protein [Euryarchaeota archaeon]